MYETWMRQLPVDVNELINALEKQNSFKGGAHNDLNKSSNLIIAFYTELLLKNASNKVKN